LTALGVAQPRPVSSLPNVPPLANGSLARLDLTAWFGFFVPKGTPDDIVTLLNTRLRQILDTPEMQQRLVETGVEPASMSAAQFEQFVANERTKYGRFISELAIQTE
jgi:tripartite-type tricarboxylate transporter receptor subunit TctC